MSLIPDQMASKFDDVNWVIAFWCLMLVGGEIVELAFAKSLGLSPVPFSFGWLQYLTRKFCTTVEGKSVSNGTMLINVKSGYTRNNQSWILNQIFKDWQQRTPPRSSLNVEIFKVVKPSVYHTFPEVVAYGTVLIQLWLSVSAALDGRRSATLPLVVLAIFFNSIINALAGNLKDRFGVQALHGKSKAVILTPGNGSRHAMVITDDDGVGVDLEQLAMAVPPQSNRVAKLTGTFLTGFVVAFIFSMAPPDRSLVRAAFVGFLYNMWLAFQPASYGVDLDSVTTVAAENSKVFHILIKLEEERAGAGLSLVPIFFPGELREDEKLWVEERKKLNSA